MTGIRRSVKTRLMRSRSRTASASWPLLASTTRNPAYDTCSTRIERTRASSSMTRIVYRRHGDRSRTCRARARRRRSRPVSRGRWRGGPSGGPRRTRRPASAGSGAASLRLARRARCARGGRRTPAGTGAAPASMPQPHRPPARRLIVRGRSSVAPCPLANIGASIHRLQASRIIYLGHFRRICAACLGPRAAAVATEPRAASPPDRVYEGAGASRPMRARYVHQDGAYIIPAEGFGCSRGSPSGRASRYTRAPSSA